MNKKPSSLIKDFFTGIFRPVLTSSRDFKSTVEENKSALNNRLKALTEGRERGADKGFQENFGLVLKAWGIKKEQLPQVLRDLKIRMVLFLCPTALAFIMLYMKHFYVACLIMLCSIIGFFVTAWRYHVLQTKQYKPIPGEKILRFILRK